MRDDTCMVCCCNAAEGDFSSGCNNARDTTTTSSVKQWRAEEAWETQRCRSMNDLSTSSSSTRESSNVSNEEEKDYPDACGEELWSLWVIANLAFAAVKSLTARSSEARMQRRTNARKQELLEILGASNPAAKCAPPPVQQVASAPVPAPALLPVSLNDSRSSLIYTAVVALLRSVWRRDQIAIAAAALARTGSIPVAAPGSAAAADPACVSSASVPAFPAGSPSLVATSSSSHPLAAAASPASASNDIAGASAVAAAAGTELPSEKCVQTTEEDLQTAGDTRERVSSISPTYPPCAYATGKWPKNVRCLQRGSRTTPASGANEAAAASPLASAATVPAPGAGSAAPSVSFAKSVAFPGLPLRTSAALGAATSATPRRYVRLIYEGWLLKESKWRKRWRPRYVLLLSVEHCSSSNREEVELRINGVDLDRREEQGRELRRQQEHLQLQQQQQRMAAPEGEQPEGHPQEVLSLREQGLLQQRQWTSRRVPAEEMSGCHLLTSDAAGKATRGSFPSNVVNSSTLAPHRSWSRTHGSLDRVAAQKPEDPEAEAAWQFEHDTVAAAAATGVPMSAHPEEAGRFVQTGQRRNSDSSSKATSAFTSTPPIYSSATAKRHDSSADTSTKGQTILLVTYDHNPRFPLRCDRSRHNSAGNAELCAWDCYCGRGCSICNQCCRGYQEDVLTSAGAAAPGAGGATAAVFPCMVSPCSPAIAEGNVEQDRQDAQRTRQNNQQESVCVGCTGGCGCLCAGAAADSSRSCCGAASLRDTADTGAAGGGCYSCCHADRNERVLQLLRRAAAPTEVLQLSAETARLGWMYISFRQLDLQLPLHRSEVRNGRSTCRGFCRTAPSTRAAVPPGREGAGGPDARAAATLRQEEEQEECASRCSKLTTPRRSGNVFARRNCCSSACSASLEDNCSSRYSHVGTNEGQEWKTQGSGAAEAATVEGKSRGRGKLDEKHLEWLTLAVRDKTTRRRVRFASSLLVGDAAAAAAASALAAASPCCSTRKECAAAKVACGSVSCNPPSPGCAACHSKAAAAPAEPSLAAGDAAGAGFVAAAAAVSRLKHPVHLRQHFGCPSLHQCSCSEQPPWYTSGSRCGCALHDCCCRCCWSSSSGVCCCCWGRWREGRLSRSCSCHNCTAGYGCCGFCLRCYCVCDCCGSLPHAEGFGSRQRCQARRRNIGDSNINFVQAETATYENFSYKKHQVVSSPRAAEDENNRKGSLCNSISWCSTNSGGWSNGSGIRSNNSSGHSSSSLTGSKDVYSSSRNNWHSGCCDNSSSSETCRGGEHEDEALGACCRGSTSCSPNGIHVSPRDDRWQDSDACCCWRSEPAWKCAAAVGAAEDLQMWCAKINELLSVNKSSSLSNSNTDTGCYCNNSCGNGSSCSSCGGGDGVVCAGVCESLPPDNPLHMFLSRASVAAVAAAATCTSSGFSCTRGTDALRCGNLRRNAYRSSTVLDSKKARRWSSSNARWSVRNTSQITSKFQLPELLLRGLRSCNSSHLPRLSQAFGCYCCCYQEDTAGGCGNSSGDRSKSSYSSNGSNSSDGSNSSNNSYANSGSSRRRSRSRENRSLTTRKTPWSVATCDGEIHSNSWWKYDSHEGRQGSSCDHKSSYYGWKLPAFSDRVYRMLLEQQKICAALQQQGPWICELQQQQHSSIALLSSSGYIMPRVQSWLQAAARENKVRCTALPHHGGCSSIRCHSGTSTHDNNHRSSSCGDTWLVPLMCRLPSSCWLRRKSESMWQQPQREWHQSQQERFSLLQQGTHEGQQGSQPLQQHEEGISQQLLQYEQELLHTFRRSVSNSL